MDEKVLIVGLDPKDEPLFSASRDGVIFLASQDIARPEDIPQGIEMIYLVNSLPPGDKRRIGEFVERRKITRLAIVYGLDDLLAHVKGKKENATGTARPPAAP